MSDHPVLAFLDSTELSLDSSLKSAKWDSLRRAIADGQLVLAVSEVTIGEVSRRVAERGEKFNELQRDHRRQLGAHLRELGVYEPVDVSNFEAEFRARLAESGVLVLDFPVVSHAALVVRELAGERPFKRNGSGYRDALIWMTLVEWAEQDAFEHAEIYFVSANRSDFADSSGALHTDLRKDLAPGAKVTLVERLQPGVDAVRPPIDWLGVDEPIAVTRATAAALAEIDSYLRFPADDLPIEEPYVDMPPFDRGFITSLTLDRDSAEATLIDKVDDIQIWDVAATARLTLEARAWSWSDARDLPDGWRLLNPHAETEPPLVEGTFDSTWLADVRVSSSGGDAIDAAIRPCC